MYDIIIRNGTILDGTGGPGYRSDLAVKDGKIARIARKIDGEAAQIIDAAGLVVTPGFIDSHSHSDKEFYTDPVQVEKVEQGITTSVGGQCGGSVCCADAAEFLDAAPNVKLGANMAMLIGHGSLRRAVIGPDSRVPSEEEMEKMKAILRTAMEHGALGISYGLIYAPSYYAKTPELIELAKVVQEYQGIVAAHIRGEGPTLIRATEEFIQIVRESGARGVLSHHKSCGNKENWGKVHTTLRMLDQAAAEGVDIWCDVYPYTATHTSMGSTFVPPEYHTRGSEGVVEALTDPETRAKIKTWGKERWGEDLSWVQVTACRAWPEYQGMLLPDIAKARGTDAYDAAFDIIAECKNTGSNACYFTICEEDVETVMAWPKAMICTDAGVTAKPAGAPVSHHPRLRGSFPRALGRYVRERGVVSLPEMIRKMTSMPAAVYGFKKKGLLVEGFDADICIFDPDRIIDHSTFTECHLHAEGLNYVLVGGLVAAKDAVATGEMGGTLLLRDV